MSDYYKQFEQRKQEHIKFALLEENQTVALNELDKISLIHEALPDINFSEIDITSSRFSKEVLNPFTVASMTAGHKDAFKINHNLVQACAQMSWAMGVGSQRRELTDSKASFDWVNIRRDFPKVSLFSNLGIAQVIYHSISDIKKIIESIEACALIVHCNPLQECIQPEGTPDFKGSLKALENLVKNLDIPLIIKETGCGFSKNTLKKLNEIGVSGVEVSGLGGTHWGRIEGKRAIDDTIRQRAAITFANWGITSVKSVVDAISLNPTYEVWGSGGVRNGLDAAKLIALGASTISFAKPLLKAALDSKEAVITLMQTIEYELKVAMFCTGSMRLNDLKEKVCL